MSRSIYPLFPTLALLVAGIFPLACDAPDAMELSPKPQGRGTSHNTAKPQSQPSLRVEISTARSAPPSLTTTPTTPGVAATKTAPPPLPKTLLEREMLGNIDSPERAAKETGRQLFRDKAFTESIQALRSGLASSPEDAGIWTLLGRAYLKTGEPSRGIDCLREAATFAPNDAAISAFIVRGLLNEETRDDALRAARDLAGLEPNSFRSAYLLGRAFSINQMWHEALEAYESALTFKPNHTFANNNLGFVALQVGETARAISALEKATEQEDARTYMFNSLGVAYERAKSPVNAMTAFYNALQRNPKYVKAIVNRDRVSATLTPEQHSQYIAWQEGTLFDQDQLIASAATVEAPSSPISSLPPSEEPSVGESVQGNLPPLVAP